MEERNGDFFMNGIPADDPRCLRLVEDLKAKVLETGFLPLFQNEVPGFSVEEMTAPEGWFSDDPLHDPWYWRTVIAREGEIAYGKFFGNRAGFISREWLPYFANYRRDGYDFDALWDDEKAPRRQKLIMDLFTEDTELYSFEVKQRAGFHKDGEKNFEGTITALQMELYLSVCDFRKRKNKQGREYGWDVAVYSMPEHIFGYPHVTSAYREDPADSFEKILRQVRKYYPEAKEKDILKVIK